MLVENAYGGATAAAVPLHVVAMPLLLPPQKRGASTASAEARTQRARLSMAMHAPPTCSAGGGPCLFCALVG